MLSALDDNAGAVLAKLREAGLEEDTLVVFISDNGGPTMLGTTINGSRNDPLRGSKRTTLEGGIRVPFVLSWKGKLPAGKVYDQPVIQLDVLPTALAAAGVAVKPEWELDGVDLLPYLTGRDEKAPHDTLYWRLGGQAAIRRGDWKLVRYDSTVDTPGRGRTPARRRPSARSACTTWPRTSARPTTAAPTIRTRPRSCSPPGRIGAGSSPSPSGGPAAAAAAATKEVRR